MDGIYRIPPTVAEAPRDRGIVGEIIGQFADPFAFYRELVQNAIDAGTPSIDVHLDHDPEAQVARVSVRDHGEGMTRDIVENQLLVLFRSTKEHDDTKIGKFGIGFASVLAPGPNVVVVQTSRDGRRLTLHLQRDLSYELFDAGPSTRAGTSIELEIPLTTPFPAFVAASRAALVTWCRHATVPIQLVARDGGTTIEDTRIDRPLALEHPLVEVRSTSPDGATIAVVGLTTEPTAYAGFFDHGLTLYEDTDPTLAGQLAFKVQDARLAHTLSRDNVRRDAAFDRAVEYVGEVVRGQLPAAAAEAVRTAAEAGDHARYVELATAIGVARLRIDRDAWTFPLIDPIDGRRAATLAQLAARPLAARAASPVTAMLAAAGVPVIDLGTRFASDLQRLLQGWIGDPLVDVEHALTRVAPVAATDADVALLAVTSQLIAAAHSRPGALLLAELDGAFTASLAITGERDDAAYPPADDHPQTPWLIERRRAGRRAFGWLSNAPVVISARHLDVVAARRIAATDPVAAGSVLARLLLLGGGELDVERSTTLLSATLDALGVGSGGAGGRRR